MRAAAHLRVDDLVPAQRAGLTESFPAHFTHEGPSSGVHRHVSGQVVMRVKYLRTHRILWRFILTVLESEMSVKITSFRSFSFFRSF